MTDLVALHHAYEWERKTPDRPWLVQPMGQGVVREMTWRQAMDEVRRMAAHLASLDLPPGSHVALFSKNSAWWILADLAIMMAGHVSIPLYPTLTPDTIAQILDHSESKLVFVGKLDGFEEMAPGIPADLPRIVLPLAPDGAEGTPWEEIVAKTEAMEDSPHRQPSDLETIVYTSGSTGVPKGVMHTFETTGRATVGVIRHLGIGAEDRMLSYLPLAHVFERWIVEHASLFSGMQLYFAESLDTFVQDLQRARPTLFVSVPRLWQKFQSGVFEKMPPPKLDLLLKLPIVGNVVRKKILRGLGLDAVRFAGSGSAPIPAALIQWYRDLGLELLEGYGMSENFSYSHVSRPGEVRVGYVGKPYPDVECRLSEEGEILVKSPANMVGYYKMEEETKAAFTSDGFLRTGDRGEIDEEGRLRITGRVKDLFKTSKGKYVAPAPIENRLQLSEHIEMACVEGSGQPQPCAVVVLSEASRAAMETEEGRTRVVSDIERHLGAVNRELDHHEQLAFVAVVPEAWTVEEGFLTPTMKIRRSKIAEVYGPRLADWYGSGRKVLVASPAV
ncbi:MAG: AMP-binding acetyl-CoA synthetase [Deltaproteobacteria bacterium]|nr:MAG: AMP-binding acetyl-CoA synthetase [Deltaproteobacteria bacterium]